MINKFSVLKSNLISGYKPVQGSNLMEPIYVPCLTMVCETPSSRGYGYVVFTVDHAKKDVIILAHCPVKFLTNDVKNLISSVVTPKGSRTYDVDITNTNCSLPSNNLLIDTKLDNVFFSSNLRSYDYSSLKLADRDTNNVSLNAYVNQIGTLMDTQGNPVTLTDSKVKAVARKICNAYRDPQWNLFYESPDLTDAEKQSATQKLNINISYSNRNNPIRNNLVRSLYVDLSSRPWVFNMLSGVPGSGKTSMVMEDICAMYNIPCVYILGDARASISKMIALVGPTKQDDGKVELTLTESVWAKCLKHNLPLVVFFDEIDTLASLELKLLGSLATSGRVTINTEHYNNTARSIYYFAAFNPGSVNASEFPESLEDRVSWYNVKMPSLNDRIKFNYLNHIAKFTIQSKKNLLSYIITNLESLKTTYPEHSDNVDTLLSHFNKIDLRSCDSEALLWYLDTKTKELLLPKSTPTFKEGVFVDAYAHQLNAITPSSTQFDIDVINIFKTAFKKFCNKEFEDTAEAEYLQNSGYTIDVEEKLTTFYAKLNTKLAELTRGIQKTKRDRNACITLPQRYYDIFVDLIFSYSSVAKAFEFAILNRLPEGFVLNVPGVNTTPGVDEAPSAIYKALYSYLEADIKDLHNYLFNSSNIQEAEDEYAEYVTKLQYVAPVTQQTQPGASTPSLQEQLSQANNSQLDSWIDDLDDLDM